MLGVSRTCAEQEIKSAYRKLAMRELLKDVSLKRVLSQRSPREFQTDLFGRAAPRPAFVSRTAEWLSMPPAFPLNRLSATAVDNYEVCPLQFKLEREWRLPRDVPAAMQYGASIHRVLRTYFDSVKLQRPLSEAQLIDLFEVDLGQLVIEDPYQRQLYHAKLLDPQLVRLPVLQEFANAQDGCQWVVQFMAPFATGFPSPNTRT